MKRQSSQHSPTLLVRRSINVMNDTQEEGIDVIALGKEEETYTVWWNGEGFREASFYYSLNKSTKVSQAEN